MEDGDGLQYLLTDHLGSVSAVLDASGGLLSQQRYMPFGAERLEPDISQTDFGFTGQRDLAAAGLMDYNARWLNANVGAFTQPDTIVPDFGNPQTLNRFAYALANPIRMIDLSGNKAEDVGGGGDGRCKGQRVVDCAVYPVGWPRSGYYIVKQDKDLSPLLEDIDTAIDVIVITTERKLGPASLVVNFTSGYEQAQAEGETEFVSVSRGAIYAGEQAVVSAISVGAALEACAAGISLGCAPPAVIVYVGADTLGNNVSDYVNEVAVFPLLRYFDIQLSLLFGTDW